MIDTLGPKLAWSVRPKHWRRSASTKAKDSFVHGISTIKIVKDADFWGV